jgi:hypothetical protein
MAVIGTIKPDRAMPLPQCRVDAIVALDGARYFAASTDADLAAARCLAAV